MAEKVLPPPVELNGSANGSRWVGIGLAELQEQFEALGRELLQQDPVALMVSTNALRREAQLLSPPGRGANHPLMAVAGVYKNDSTFDALLERIAEYRREIDSVLNTLQPDS